MIKAIQLTQANNNEKVLVFPQHVFYVYYSHAHKATHVVTIAGAALPVKESRDDVIVSIENQINKKETINERGE